MISKAKLYADHVMYYQNKILYLQSKEYISDKEKDLLDLFQNELEYYWSLICFLPEYNHDYEYYMTKH